MCAATSPCAQAPLSGLTKIDTSIERYHAARLQGNKNVLSNKISPIRSLLETERLIDPPRRRLPRSTPLPRWQPVRPPQVCRHTCAHDGVPGAKVRAQKILQKHAVGHSPQLLVLLPSRPALPSCCTCQPLAPRFFFAIAGDITLLFEHRCRAVSFQHSSLSSSRKASCAERSPFASRGSLVSRRGLPVSQLTGWSA